MSKECMDALDAFVYAGTLGEYARAMELANELSIPEQLTIIDAIIDARKRVVGK